MNNGEKPSIKSIIRRSLSSRSRSRANQSESSESLDDSRSLQHPLLVIARFLQTVLACMLPLVFACGEQNIEAPSEPDAEAAPPPDEVREKRPAPPPREEPARREEPLDPLPSPAKAGLMIEIAGTRVLAGSEPGSEGRFPGTEMDDESLPVGPFRIDALPYPNDPEQPPLTNVNWRKAAALCREEGKRLCHELEWEVACEGDDGRSYPYGDRFDAKRYEDPLTVSSRSGVRAFGSIGEWTLAAFVRAEEANKAIRGSGDRVLDAATGRCAFRSKQEPRFSSTKVGFRCCKGSPPSEAYRTPPPFNRLESLGEPEAFQAMIRSVPELEEIHDDPQMFTREAVYHVMHISKVAGPHSVKGTTYTWLPIRWVPRPDQEFVVATGKHGRDTFVVVLDYLPGGRFGHAASLILRNDDDPVILAYTRNPRHAEWLPCIGCRDGGLITMDEDEVVIAQRW